VQRAGGAGSIVALRFYRSHNRGARLDMLVTGCEGSRAPTPPRSRRPEARRFRRKIAPNRRPASRADQGAAAGPVAHVGELPKTRPKIWLAENRAVCAIFHLLHRIVSPFAHGPGHPGHPPTYSPRRSPGMNAAIKIPVPCPKAGGGARVRRHRRACRSVEKPSSLPACADSKKKIGMNILSMSRGRGRI